MSGASITANTIPSSAIVGGVGGGGASLSTANTWSALQTFNSGIGLPTSIPSVITGNRIGTTIYGATNITGSHGAGEVMANLTLSPANSVWLVSYSFAFYSSNSAYQQHPLVMFISEMIRVHPLKYSALQIFRMVQY
jgi:hypothetical protein